MPTINRINVNSTTYDIASEAPNVAFQPSQQSGSLSTATTVQEALDIVDGLNMPNITYGTADPAGGSNGDIYIKYEV